MSLIETYVQAVIHGDTVVSDSKAIIGDIARALDKEKVSYELESRPEGEWAIYRKRIDPESCSGHVASNDDPKVCARCGVHIDELRP